ncbi:MAG: trehalose-6-phosphate synthase, partial [Deltaproteobacteria bacterium]|nr:trehalose-6-phosphate synthase [Deltaproteobacteria bacterium]
EFAGAASQLQRGAILVNPNDREGVAEAIHRAYTMPEPERRNRMKAMRTSIRRHNIYDWVDSYLKAALARRLGDFPMVEEYVPAIALHK